MFSTHFLSTNPKQTQCPFPYDSRLFFFRCLFVLFSRKRTVSGTQLGMTQSSCHPPCGYCPSWKTGTLSSLIPTNKTRVFSWSCQLSVPSGHSQMSLRMPHFFSRCNFSNKALKTTATKPWHLPFVELLFHARRDAKSSHVPHLHTMSLWGRSYLTPLLETVKRI